MTSREKFEAFLVSEYEWGNDALNAANFHGDDATGYYTGRDFIYDGQSCSECLFWAWRGWQAAELASEQKLTDMAVQLANAESKCRELAVENGGLKKAADFATAPDMWIEQDDGMLDYRYCEWYVDALKAAMETPATDAFLAEVLAQGVEMFVSHMDHPHSPYEFTHGYMDKHAIEFAAKLRQGAAL